MSSSFKDLVLNLVLLKTKAEMYENILIATVISPGNVNLEMLG